MEDLNNIPLKHQPAGSIPIDQLLDQEDQKRKNWREDRADLVVEIAMLKNEVRGLRAIIQLMEKMQ